MIKPSIAPVASALLLLACASCASQPERGRGGSDGQRGERGERGGGPVKEVKSIGLLFASMDMNRDTLVDGAELTDAAGLEWRRMTPDETAGALEYEAWSLSALGSSEALPAFISFDRDLDGKIDWDDFSGGLRREFEEMDLDNSGTLTRAELITASTPPARQENRSGGGERSRGGGDRGGGGDRRPR